LSLIGPVEEPSEQQTAPTRSLRLELPRDARAPAFARAAVSGLCHEPDFPPSQRQTLILLVSELVSNAVLHSTGPADVPILLAATVAEEMIRIAVSDAGLGFSRGTPRDAARGEGGYGLYLVNKAASRWGVHERGGTRVWFELALTS
jgi:anti-sigma regulatory factor (Ser/Thr protein kinase)